MINRKCVRLLIITGFLLSWRSLAFSPSLPNALSSLPYHHDSRLLGIQTSETDILRPSIEINKAEDLMLHANSRSGRDADAPLLSTRGYVCRSRPLGKALLFLDIQSSQGRIECIMKRQDYYNETQFGVDAAILSPGVHLSLQGRAEEHRKDHYLFVVERSRLLRPNGNPQHLGRVLRLVRDGLLDIHTVATALDISTAVLDEQIYQNRKDLYSLSKFLLANMTVDLIEPSKLLTSASTRKQQPSALFLPLPSHLETYIMPDDANMITCKGIVQNRLRYQDNVTQIIIQQESVYGSSGEEQPQMCILHPQAVGNMSYIYSSICAPGSQIEVHGWIDADSETLWMSQVPTLVRSSARPQTVRYLIDLAHRRVLDATMVARALETPKEELENVLLESATRRHWFAAERARLMENESSRVGTVTKEMIDVLNKFAYLREKHPMTMIESNQSNSAYSGSSFSSRWLRAKQPQLEWMLERIDQLLTEQESNKVLAIVDVGGGKGHLASLLAETFGPDRVHVRVVDINTLSIRNGQMRAMRRHIHNVQFQAADATTVEFDRVDLVVALHACGALSDVALSLAARHGSSFVICPCCFCSNAFLKIPRYTSSGVSKIDPADWLGITPVELDALKRAAELQGDRTTSEHAIHTICALRARATITHSSKGSSTRASIQCFPIGISTRNFCIVGESRVN